MLGLLDCGFLDNLPDVATALSSIRMISLACLHVQLMGVHRTCGYANGIGLASGRPPPLGNRTRIVRH